MGLHFQLVSWWLEPADSSIKKQRAHKQCVMPDRTDVTMTVPFMDAYVRLLIQTCHK